MTFTILHWCCFFMAAFVVPALVNLYKIYASRQAEMYEEYMLNSKQAEKLKFLIDNQKPSELGDQLPQVGDCADILIDKEHQQ